MQLKLSGIWACEFEPARACAYLNFRHRIVRLISGLRISSIWAEKLLEIQKTTKNDKKRTQLAVKYSWNAKCSSNWAWIATRQNEIEPNMKEALSQIQKALLKLVKNANKRTNTIWHTSLCFASECQLQFESISSCNRFKLEIASCKLKMQAEIKLHLSLSTTTLDLKNWQAQMQLKLSCIWECEVVRKFYDWLQFGEVTHHWIWIATLK